MIITEINKGNSGKNNKGNSGKKSEMLKYSAHRPFLNLLGEREVHMAKSNCLDFRADKIIYS